MNVHINITIRRMDTQGKTAVCVDDHDVLVRGLVVVRILQKSQNAGEMNTVRFITDFAQLFNSILRLSSTDSR